MKDFFKNNLHLNAPNIINVVFCFPKQSFSLLNYIELNQNVVLYKNITLKKQFKDFILSNINIYKYKKVSFFLKKDNKIIKLNAGKTISQLGLKNGDIIFISYYESKVEEPKIKEEKIDQTELLNSKIKVFQEKTKITQIEQNLPKKMSTGFKFWFNNYIINNYYFINNYILIKAKANKFSFFRKRKIYY